MPSFPRDKDSLDLIIINSFNSISRGSRCCLDFTSTIKDDLELWWTVKPFLDNLIVGHPIGQPIYIPDLHFFLIFYIRSTTHGHAAQIICDYIVLSGSVKDSHIVIFQNLNNFVYRRFNSVWVNTYWILLWSLNIYMHSTYIVSPCFKANTKAINSRSLVG